MRRKNKSARLAKPRYGCGLAGIVAGAMLVTSGLAGCGLAPHEKNENPSVKTNRAAHPLRVGANVLPNYVTVAATEPTGRLLPVAAADKDASKIARLLFSGLAYLDERGNVKNDVATAIIPNENCTLYDVEIRSDLYFSDGTPVRAANFSRTWSDAVRNVAIRPEATLLKAVRGYGVTSGGFQEGPFPGIGPNPQYRPASAAAGEPGKNPLTPELEGIEVLSDTHFKIHLTRPTCDFVKRIATPMLAALPHAAFDANGKILPSFVETPYGYGPYMLAREGAWERGLQLNLLPNERYKGPRRPKNEGISFKFYRDQDSSYKDLQRDELDVDDELPVASLKTYRDQLGARCAAKPNSISSYLVLPRDPRFAPDSEEGRLRRLAISLSLKREEITRTFFGSLPVPATDFVSPTTLGHDTSPGSNAVLGHDAARAREAWEQANAMFPWNQELVLARVDSESGEWMESAATQIRSTLGISVRVISFPDRAALNKALVAAGKTGDTGAQQFGYYNSWEPKYPGMQAYLWPLFAFSGIANESGYHNSEFEDLISQARAAVSEYASSRIYAKAQGILLRDLPVIPLWYQKSAVGWSTKVANLHLDWQGIPQYWRITKD